MLSPELVCGYTGALTKAGIKFTPAVASVFCWVDLRSALPEATWEAERQLWEEGFVQRCGFIITPGANSQHTAMLYVLPTSMPRLDCTADLHFLSNI